jgi:hypothetical protein
MSWERINNNDQPNETQTVSPGLTPTNGDWQGFNAGREGSWNSANQSLIANSLLPNTEIFGLSNPMEPTPGAAQPTGTGGAGEGSSASNGWPGWFGGEGGSQGWQQNRGQFGGGESGSAEGNTVGGDLLADKILSDPTMLQALHGLQGQMTAQGFSALEQSLTQNLSMNPYTSDSTIMQQAYQQLSGMGASSQDLTALQDLIATGGDSTGAATTAVTGGDSTGTTTPTGADTTGSIGSTSSDPIIQQFSQSDPELAQILTDTQAQLSPQGYSQFEQTVAQNWATGQSPDDATLLQQSLSQFQQQGGSAADVSAASNMIQNDLQTYGDSAVSTYQGSSSTGTSTGTGGDSGTGTTTTTSGTGGDSGTGTTTTTSGTGGDSGTSTTTTTSGTGGDSGTGTTTTTSGNGLLVGVDTHPETSSAYSSFTPTQLADNVKSMGFNAWEMDLYSGDSESGPLLAAAKADNLQVIANIYIPDKSNPTNAYNSSYQEGAAMGALAVQEGVPNTIFQADNELDGFASQSSNNFDIAKEGIQGLIAGVESTDPGAKTIVNAVNDSTGLSFLQQLQQAGVNWDYTGVHWYSPDGSAASLDNTLAGYQALGKPLYFSEINGDNNGNAGPSTESNNAQTLTAALSTMASTPNTVGGNIYELYNEPNQSGDQAGYGLLNTNGAPTASSQAVEQWIQQNNIS